MWDFTTRELAATIWIAVFAAWAFSRAEVRAGFWRVVKSALAYRLIIVWIFGGAWMAAGVFFLSKLQIWSPANLKDTLIWCFTAGIVILVHGFSQKEKKPDYPKITLDLFKLTVLLEIVLSTYCFRLPVELALFLAIAITAAVRAVSETEEKYEPVRKLTTGILGILGLTMIWGALDGLIRSPKEVLTVETLKALVRPVLLTIWLIPVSYALGVIGAYQILFVPFALGEKRQLKFHILARIKLILFFGFRLNRVLEAPRQLRGGLYGTYHLDEVEQTLTELKRCETESSQQSATESS